MVVPACAADVGCAAGVVGVEFLVAMETMRGVGGIARALVELRVSGVDGGYLFPDEKKQQRAVLEDPGRIIQNAD